MGFTLVASLALVILVLVLGVIATAAARSPASARTAARSAPGPALRWLAGQLEEGRLEGEPTLTEVGTAEVHGRRGERQVRATFTVERHRRHRHVRLALSVDVGTPGTWRAYHPLPRALEKPLVALFTLLGAGPRQTLIVEGHGLRIEAPARQTHPFTPEAARRLLDDEPTRLALAALCDGSRSVAVEDGRLRAEVDWGDPAGLGEALDLLVALARRLDGDLHSSTPGPRHRRSGRQADRG
ncbi:MAG: hypothetical protein KF878_02845 [Planctomycetes bacterium]|nr:hypothetical protein [Planctomycetota bacterium]